MLISTSKIRLQRRSDVQRFTTFSPDVVICFFRPHAIPKNRLSASRPLICETNCGHDRRIFPPLLNRVERGQRAGRRRTGETACPGEKKPVIENYSITVLDNHGATVAATAQRVCHLAELRQ